MLAELMSTKGLRTGVPDELRLNLEYNETISISISAGLAQSYVFAGNSCFDPNVSGTGAQPLYFSTLVNIYTRYRVHASRMRATIIPSTNSTDIVDCVIAPLPTSSTYTVTTTMDNLKAQRFAKQGFSPPGARPLILDTAVSSGEIFGLPYNIVDVDDVFQAGSSSNPSRLWIYQFATVTADLSSSATVRVNFKLIYDVTMFGRQLVTQ